MIPNAEQVYVPESDSSASTTIRMALVFSKVTPSLLHTRVAMEVGVQSILRFIPSRRIILSGSWGRSV